MNEKLDTKEDNADGYREATPFIAACNDDDGDDDDDDDIRVDRQLVRMGYRFLVSCKDGL